VRSTSFYFSFLALPGPKRRAITAVFDFCRAVDDCVDLEPDTARAVQALERWRTEIGRVFTGASPETPEGRQLQAVAAPFHLPREQFYALVDGVSMDAEGRRYATFAELEQYCHRVASAVGLICAEIFEYDDRSVLTYARDLGVALQLTNILRDVGQDFRNGRRYLPQEDLDRFACTWDDIGAEIQEAGRGIRSPKVKAVLEHQGARARVFFARATRALPPAEAQRFVAAEIMRAVYWDLLRRIEDAHYDVFSHVRRVPRLTQAALALRMWLTRR
jgi:phytoene synthase